MAWLSRLPEYHRGYFCGVASAAILAVLAWSAVLCIQAVTSHRVPIEAVQHRQLSEFPPCGIVVVSKACSLGTENPPKTGPLFDFATVVALTPRRAAKEGDGPGATVTLKRPGPDRVIWRQHQHVNEDYDGSGKLTCSYTTAGFLQSSGTQCLERTFDGQHWVSKKGWVACTKDAPSGSNLLLDPLTGLNVGNWSTKADSRLGLRAYSQALESWPNNAFFVLPAAADDLEAAVERVDSSLRQVLASIGSASQFVETSMPAVLQEALTAKFIDGVWLFQASNMDPFANVGPLAVTLRSNRCEGRCANGVQQHSISATAVSLTPPWRQPLCNPGVTLLSAHQGCVPIVFVADMTEKVLVSTVALRWPDLLTQWLAPLIAFVAVCPLLLAKRLHRTICGHDEEAGTEAEAKSLVLEPDTVGLSTPQLDFGT